MLSPAELTHLAHALHGLPIMGCSQGSPAARAGLRYGDIVLALDGAPTPSWAAFFQALGGGCGAVTMRVFRRGLELQLSLKLSAAWNTPRAVLEREGEGASCSVPAAYS